MPTEPIAILGAGTMGANLALAFAAHGFPVLLNDASAAALDRAEETIRQNASTLRAEGLVPDTAPEIEGLIRFTTAPGEAVRDAQLVIEAIPEDLELKRRVFRDLEGQCRGDAILASNTSTFMPSLLVSAFSREAARSRFLVAHFWNPAHLIPLVEIVPHAGTSPQVVTHTRSLLERIGKLPVVLQREVPGFIGNRLAFALQREAMSLVAQGVASPEDIDLVARTSFGRRLPISGIFGTADLGGLDVYLAVARVLFPDLSNADAAPSALAERVAAGKLGLKTGEGWKRYSAAEADSLRAALAQELLRRAREDRAG